MRHFNSLLLLPALLLMVSAETINLTSNEGVSSSFTGISKASVKGVIAYHEKSGEVAIPWERLDLQALETDCPHLHEAYEYLQIGANEELDLYIGPKFTPEMVSVPEVDADGVKLVEATDLETIMASEGETLRVRGTVTNNSTMSFKGDNFVKFADTDFILYCNRHNGEKFPEPPAELYIGQEIIVKGVILVYKDTWEIKLTDPAQVEVIGGEREEKPLAAEFEELEGCKYLSSSRNDGDSFITVHDGKNYVFRLYFIDTPETETTSGFMAERLADQAEYFSLPEEEVLELARIASEYTASKLVKGFKVYTRWERVFNSDRYYAFISWEEGGEEKWLDEELTSCGFSRFKTKGAPHPQGKSVLDHKVALTVLEEQAKDNKRGGWK